MSRQEISIYLQNVVDYLKFFIKHPKFQQNQTYETSDVFHKSENQVYNEIYTSKW